MIIQQPEASQHDPNEALDQILADNLTQDVPQDEDEATRTARRARNQRKGERRVQAAERARLPREPQQRIQQRRESSFQNPNRRDDRSNLATHIDASKPGDGACHTPCQECR